MEKWFVAAKKADFNAWAEKFNISPVLARIIRNRDITEEAQVDRFLNGKLQDCHSPFLLKDMDKAVDYILDAIKTDKRLRVIGDYDVDGICSSYIFTKGLKLLGATVDTVIPHRVHDGYGLSDKLIEDAKADGVDIILTCDNGISASKQIALANSLGIKVIVTDHHEVPYVEENGIRTEVVPDALAVVDPKQEKCGYPFKNICGGVVVYKLMQAICEKTGHASLTAAMEEFVEFAALATVCDVMELLDENRILVKAGLERMKNSKNLGLKCLIEVNELDVNKISAYTLGFVIGPCLNASGRLDTAERALELLQCDSKAEAMTMAKELKDINDSRKNLTLQGVEEAVKYIEDNECENDRVLIVFLPELHESLAGIIAGRIREIYNKPAFVLTRGEEGVKGSGRSIDAYHMYDAMTEVKEMFTKYGGHKLAAGLSMREEDVARLRERLNEKCSLTDEDFIPKVQIDVPMPISYASLELAYDLQKLEPFGTGNPKPLFAQKDLTVISASKMGKGGTSAKFVVATPDNVREEVILFKNLDQFQQVFDQKNGDGSYDKLFTGTGTGKISIVYQLNINSFRGRNNKQLIITNFS